MPGADELLGALVERDVLVEEGSELAERDELVETTWRWPHEARFLHFSTQALRFEPDIEVEQANLAALAATRPPPSPYKRCGGEPVPLPGGFGDQAGGLWDVLRERRTRRRFARTAIPLATFAALLRWTWGKTEERTHEVLGRYVLKTSPSGGARHSTEVYAAPLRVEGLDPGLYHYAVEADALEPLGPRAAGELEDLVDELCSGQGWVRDAAVVFFMTAVVERSMWKYPHAHAYRVLHLDAGHLGQTFQLACTALGLATFVTTATRNRRIEETLGVDGVSEFAIYTAAAGMPA